MIKIPLELLNLHDDGFHLLVEVVVFGHSVKAVLDTGASKTVLDKTAILQLSGDVMLTLTDRLSTGLGTNAMESFIINLPEFVIGKFQISNFEAAVIDLSSINLAYNKMELPQVIGVVGGDILMKYNGIIDYGNQTLKLFPG